VTHMLPLVLTDKYFGVQSTHSEKLVLAGRDVWPVKHGVHRPLSVVFLK